MPGNKPGITWLNSSTRIRGERSRNEGQIMSGFAERLKPFRGLPWNDGAPFQTVGVLTSAGYH